MTKKLTYIQECTTGSYLIISDGYVHIINASSFSVRKKERICHHCELGKRFIYTFLFLVVDDKIFGFHNLDGYSLDFPLVLHGTARIN